YNCGASVVSSGGEIAGSNGTDARLDDEARAALDDLSAKFKIDEEEDGRLAKAAAERRKARVSNRKSVRYQWQPADESPDLLFILLTVSIVVLAAVAVALTVFWK
ncbi:MAG: hypothetical protein ABL959_07370, partial [Pyrinomonadaceae bacterium]